MCLQTLTQYGESIDLGATLQARSQISGFIFKSSPNKILKHIMYYFAVSSMKDFETAFFILDVLIRLCKDFETLEAS